MSTTTTTSMKGSIMSSMPILPIDAMVADCDDFEEAVVRAAFTTRGVPVGGRLRSNKPYRNVKTFTEGCANYVWRMLCFDLVGHGKHVCMPVCADFDVHWGFEAHFGRKDREFSAATRDMTKVLDALVARVERVLPKEAQKGILRWGRAFGMI